MSVQFGSWCFDRRPLEAGYLAQVRSILAPHGPDGLLEYSRPGIHILYFPFHTTKESRRESQPHVSASGTVFTWQGRLDNRMELIRELHCELPPDVADVAIVAAAYEKCSTECFAKLLGDWALSVWQPRQQMLLLAKDFLGSEHLYYSFDRGRITWSSILDPLVLPAEKSFEIQEEYLAGWLSLFPATHLTPYAGIHSVPPSSFVLVTNGTSTVEKYWKFDPGKIIRYQTDGEYEEHFRTVFAEAVRRRLRSDTPVLAELSGGMDSCSIVCMADTLITNGRAEAPRLDTVSYFDDSEPNWDERPYFTTVEEKRGQQGCHIDVGTEGSSTCESESHRFAVTPGSGGGRSKAAMQLSVWMKSRGHRIVLSGIGGDETTGGVPTGIPELSNLLVRGQFRLLAHRLATWAIAKRKPWFQLLFESARCFLPPALGVPKHRRSPSWLDPSFVERHQAALEGYPIRYKLFGALPSFQENLHTLESLRRQIACSTPSCDPPCEKRFPFLDRDLLEFLYAIPRDQLVRPFERRSLLRRAVAGIVPEKILHRRRKAFVARRPLIAISDAWMNQQGKYNDMVISVLHIVSPEPFRLAVARARQGLEIAAVPILRALAIEQWFEHLTSSSFMPFRQINLPGPEVPTRNKRSEIALGG